MKIEIGLVIFCFALAVAFDYQEQQNNNGEQQQFSVLSSGVSTRRKKGTPPTTAQLSTTPGSCSEISYSLPNAENQTIYFRKTRIGLPSMAPCPNNPSKLFPKKDHFF